MARRDAHLHVCEPKRRLDFAFFQLRGEIEEFDKQVTAFFESPRGRFEVWYAARRRYR